ncbi:MAG: hypothetical protein NT154_14775 [Verrucomicrobia bacterium]|nr:hypothetical protein [Verrucomicrobiota bacterium]
MKTSDQVESMSLLDAALLLLLVVFVFIVIPMLIAYGIAAWAYPLPATGTGADDLTLVNEKRFALGLKIFLAIMALLGVWIWWAA